MGKASMIAMKKTRQTINFTNQDQQKKIPPKLQSRSTKKTVANATMYEYMWCDTAKI